MTGCECCAANIGCARSLGTMEITIRKAEARDVPQMLALVKELAMFEKEPEAVTVTEEAMRDAGFGPSPVWWGWVAFQSDDQKIRRSENDSTSGIVDERKILGIAICYERYSTWRGRVGYLEDIVVTENARGLGIGELLFKACAAEAAQREYHHLTWQVLDWNEGAIRFYKRLGADLDGAWVNGRLDKVQLVELAGQ
jgi:ribosomal protein S18 acetylase RimI-like enzyme